VTGLPRTGVTLLELIVSIAIVGVLAGMAALSLRGRAPSTGTVTMSPLRVLRADRVRAMYDGIVVTGHVLCDSVTYEYSFMPNGAVVGSAPITCESQHVSLHTVP
jgi:prepilin-type N-terminal cleavage/methylation domain-containing protein